MGVLGVLVLAAAFGVDDWLAVRVRSVDASTEFAHDRVSGVIVRVGGYPRAADSLAHLRGSARLVTGRTGHHGRFTWELLELSDPASDAKALRRDMGEEPRPGTWEAAMLSAYSPSPSCALEVRYYVRKDDEPYVVFRSAPCDGKQRSRVTALVESFMAGVVPSVAAIREAQRKPAVVTSADQKWLALRPSARNAIERLGPPDEMWALYPDGFTLLYAEDADRDAYVAVDCDAGQVVKGVRVLPRSSAP